RRRTALGTQLTRAAAFKVEPGRRVVPARRRKPGGAERTRCETPQARAGPVALGTGRFGVPVAKRASNRRLAGCARGFQPGGIGAAFADARLVAARFGGTPFSIGR